MPTPVARIPMTTKDANMINVPRTPRCHPRKASHLLAVSLYGELVISSIIPMHNYTNGIDEPISENGPAGRKPRCCTINQKTPKQIQPTIPYTILFSAVRRRGVMLRYSNSIIHLNSANPVLGDFFMVHGLSIRPNFGSVNGILQGFHGVFGRMPPRGRFTFLVA